VHIYHYLDKKLPYTKAVEQNEACIVCPVCLYVSHLIFDTVKEHGVNMPELLRSVYSSLHVFNFVVLNEKSLVPFNLLIFNFYEELLEE